MTPLAGRARVLFVAEAVTLAHVARALTLARTLSPDRYDVHVAWDRRYDALLGDHQLRHHPIWSMPTPVFLRRLASGMPMHDAATLARYVDDDRALIARVKPDVVIGDFRLSLTASARLARVPLITIANAYWSPFGRQTFHFPEYDYPLSRVLGHTLALRLFDRFRPLGFAAHTRPLNTVLRRHGLPSVGGDIREMYTGGDRTAYADVPELVPTFDRPNTHRYIGAVLWSAPVPLPSWWSAIPRDRPVVYTTLGSSGDADALPVVLEALASLPVTLVVATAGRSRVEDAPANAYVADFLPGGDAAAIASIVVCNGGSPTTYQALANGVPVLALASNNMDQHLNMAAVRGAGAGLVLRARRVTTVAIRSAVGQLLESESYRVKAAALAAALRAHRCEELFPAMVDETVGRG
jgi:UDP:flavonoid glycosyltransferase YjiC (YdhE family)